jgi:hypothetical protein
MSQNAIHDLSEPKINRTSARMAQGGKINAEKIFTLAVDFDLQG